MKKQVFHTPVLLQEVIAVLDPLPGEIVVDATLGGAGHAIAISKKAKGVKIVGFDADKDTLEKAREALSRETEDFILFNRNFREIGEVLRKEEIHPDKVLFDLGVSQFTFFSSGRGFSFQRDEPLDMRFDPSSQALTASDIVNDWPLSDIENVLKAYGEEKFARKIARAIVEKRDLGKIETSSELASAIEEVFAGKRRLRIHPATQTFQALRMAVNDELDALKEGLDGAFQALKPSGRMAVISFHSLEDRIVKRFFKEKAESGEASVLIKKPMIPSSEELMSNPQSRSAKLRAIQKVSG